MKNLGYVFRLAVLLLVAGWWISPGYISGDIQQTTVGACGCNGLDDGHLCTGSKCSEGRSYYLCDPASNNTCVVGGNGESCYQYSFGEIICNPKNP